MTANPIDPRAVAALLIPHLPIYRFRSPRYRSLPMRLLFPNRLELTMRWERT